MVCSTWRHVAVRKNGDGLANRPEHKVKRACFRWGIGRELYTAPFIWVPSQVCNIYDLNGKWVCRDRFSVAKIRIEDRSITGLAIRNDETGKIVYTMVKEKN